MEKQPPTIEEIEFRLRRLNSQYQTMKAQRQQPTAPQEDPNLIPRNMAAYEVYKILNTTRILGYTFMAGIFLTLAGSLYLWWTGLIMAISFLLVTGYFIVTTAQKQAYLKKTYNLP